MTRGWDQPGVLRRLARSITTWQWKRSSGLAPQVAEGVIAPFGEPAGSRRAVSPVSIALWNAAGTQDDSGLKLNCAPVSRRSCSSFRVKLNSGIGRVCQERNSSRSANGSAQKLSRVVIVPMPTTGSFGTSAFSVLNLVTAELVCSPKKPVAPSGIE